MTTNHFAFCQFSAAVGRKGALALCVALCVLGFGVSASAQKYSIVTFDAPGASGDGTFPTGINQLGTIVGYYADANYVFHGFLRSPDGKFTTFDAPGAGTVANDSNGTFPTGINEVGTVAGYYNDANLVSHCFLRSPDGKFTTFDAPGADTNPADAAGSYITGTNALGATSGVSIDASYVYHGFLRSPQGAFTTFEAPGAGGYGTIPDGPLNLEGAIAGYYTDSNDLFRAFVRNPDGKFATFVGPGSCDTGTSTGCYGSAAYNINVFGTSAGAYEDNSGNFVQHMFLRSPDGAITTFEAPGAGTGLYQGTGFNQVAGLNDIGAVTATYLDASNVYHGFLRSPQGAFMTFEAPGADTTPGNYSGTFPVSINQSGAITGFYTDSSYVAHGFLQTP
jgi:hypothetical protein